MTTTTSRYLTDALPATDFSYPYAQALRGENPAQCGYFVPLSQAEKAGWKNLEGTEMTEYAYNSGQTEVGILLQQPRMILTPICQLGAFDRQASQTEETLVVLGEWDRAKHSKDPNAGNFQIFLVMFMDANKQPLHDIPLRLFAKGSHQATLSIEWQKFCTSVARCQAEANKNLFRPKNEVFNALCIFQPIIIRKSVGDKVKSPACYIDGYVHPTVLNWQSFFMGTDERLADAIIDILNPRSRSLLSPPTAGTIMLAPAKPDPQILQPAPAVVTAATPSVEDNSNAIDVASSPVAEELAPAPTIPTTPVAAKAKPAPVPTIPTTPVATKAKPVPEPEYIDPPEFEDDDEFEDDEVEEDKIPF
jgi:Family of unknown function (DUF5895)